MPPARRSLTRKQIYRRRRIVVFGGLFAILAGIAYLPLTLLAPVVETSPAIAAPAVEAQPAAELVWPSYGAAAVGAVGYLDDTVLGSSGSEKKLPMASIMKVITALVTLEKHPLGIDEEGPLIVMGDADIGFYNRQVAMNGSVSWVARGLDFTERELLELTLVHSANNYAESLVHWAFGSQDAFLTAARAWLEDHGLSDIRVVEPTGIDPAGTATAVDLVALGRLALQNPVVAEIVASKAVQVPDIGQVTNTNVLLGRDGIDGIKTGTLNSFGANLLFSADVEVGSTSIPIVGVVLGGPDHPRINADIRKLLASVTAGFREVPLVAAGDAFATYETPWEAEAAAIAATDASIVVWSDTPVTVKISAETIRLGEDGQPIGEAVFTAGDARVTVPLELSASIEDPGPWWRLGHPQLIFGMR